MDELRSKCRETVLESKLLSIQEMHTSMDKNISDAQKSVLVTFKDGINVFKADLSKMCNETNKSHNRVVELLDNSHQTKQLQYEFPRQDPQPQQQLGSSVTAISFMFDKLLGKRQSDELAQTTADAKSRSDEMEKERQIRAKAKDKRARKKAEAEAWLLER